MAVMTLGTAPGVDTVVDPIMALYFSYKYSQTGNTNDAIYAGTYTVATTIPIVSGSFAKTIARVPEGYADDFIKEGYKLNPDGAWGSGSVNTRANLEKFTGITPRTGIDQCHHMFPQTSEFTDFFAKQGIDVNNPVFMKWMSNTEHVGKFSSEYNRLWREFISETTETLDVNQLINKAKEFEMKARDVHVQHQISKALKKVKD
jgi:hypothetical protein